MPQTNSTIASVASALSAGKTSSRALTDAALASIAADSTAFTRVYEARAREDADAADRARARGIVPSLLAGIPISIKDLFDVAGEPTPAGSVILRDAPPAARDAPVIARLRAAGAVILGRTHMSEFAFSGLGTNPHFPVLANPRDLGRVPGGSSSGAAAAVAKEQSVVSIGTDTGGSTRIPAAFCGVTGFKPTKQRITCEGGIPLADSLDSVGPLANSVACCRTVDAILSDEPIAAHPAVAIAGLRLAVPTHYVLDGLDEIVSAAFDRALAALSRAGASVERIPFPELARIPEINARGTMVNAESFAFHQRSGLLRERERYDANVRARVEIGERMTPADYAGLIAARAVLMREADQRTQPYDALLMPTVQCVAPRFADITTSEGWARANGMALRNASVINFLGRCALSVPMHGDGELPTGLMVVGETMGDARLFAIGEAIEGILRVE